MVRIRRLVMGEHPLRGLGVSFHEFAYRQVVLLEHFVKILYRTYHKHDLLIRTDPTLDACKRSFETDCPYSPKCLEFPFSTHLGE